MLIRLSVRQSRDKEEQFCLPGGPGLAEDVAQVRTRRLIADGQFLSSLSDRFSFGELGAKRSFSGRKFVHLDEQLYSSRLLPFGVRDERYGQG
jgi:hypothetical protein